MSNIRRATIPYGNLTSVKVYVPGSTSSRDAYSLKRELRLSGAQIVDNGEDDMSSSTASMLAGDLFACAMDQTLHTIILISKDVGLSYGIALLLNRRLPLTLVVPTYGIHESLRAHATGFLDWDTEVVGSPQGRSPGTSHAPRYHSQPSTATLSAPTTTLTFSRRGTSPSVTRRGSHNAFKDAESKLNGLTTQSPVLVGYAQLAQVEPRTSFQSFIRSESKTHSRPDTPDSPPPPSTIFSKQKHVYNIHNGHYSISHGDGDNDKGTTRVEGQAPTPLSQLRQAPSDTVRSPITQRHSPSSPGDSFRSHDPLNTVNMHPLTNPEAIRSPYGPKKPSSQVTLDTPSVVSHITLTPTDGEYHADNIASTVRGGQGEAIQRPTFQNPEFIFPVYSPSRKENLPVYDFPLKEPINKVFEESPCSTPRPRAADPSRSPSPAATAIYQGSTSKPTASLPPTTTYSGGTVSSLKPPAIVPTALQGPTERPPTLTFAPLSMPSSSAGATHSNTGLNPSAFTFTPGGVTIPDPTSLYPAHNIQVSISPASAISQPTVKTPVFSPLSPQPEDVSADKGKSTAIPPSGPKVVAAQLPKKGRGYKLTKEQCKNPSDPAPFAPLLQQIRFICQGKDVPAARSAVGSFGRGRDTILSGFGNSFQRYVAAAIQAGLIEEVGKDKDLRLKTDSQAPS
ncbi:hypothetical protein AX16_010494 [Volvariella volvacea WC 439]|nr:hypothetical protein AX16_010494 [Volvariella volvacea WC 439]